MARTKMTSSEEDTHAEMGDHASRIAQTASYRKSKELGQKADDLGLKCTRRELSIHKTLAPPVESSSSESNEEDRKQVFEEEDSTEEKKVVRERASGKGKAKDGTSGQKAVQEPADDCSTPFPGGPINQTVLKSFNYHVATAIWNNKALPPGQKDRAFTVKMADEMLKHLMIIGAPTLSSTTLSGAT
ncbi:hypothetical protein Scep_004202 [Stephania cephalantha]|uniref:Uncharacterized protein n=1 Tax=Stephania cephalantha TaxID=152367 RepID=A0AAP0PV72_9MAGN